MMRASAGARLLFAVLSPIFLLLCVVAIRGEDDRGWQPYQVEYAAMLAERAGAQLAEARTAGDEAAAKRWERVVAEANRWQEEIRQVYLDDLRIADRCRTCHLGIDDPLFADAPQPFRTHPGDLLLAHDVTRFGCTLCHDGQGAATTVDAAHGHEANWASVMLAPELLQTRCTRCHETAYGLRGAEVASAGSELFLAKGCYGCHQAEDREGSGVLPKYGPPLDRLRTKLAEPAAWIAAWLKNPQQIAPHTAMPDFMLSDAEVTKITAFLATLGPDAEAKRFDATGASAARGEELFVERGCRGCHAIDAGEQGASPRVPSLVGIGSKVRPEWLDAWIRDPKQYNPDTAMPEVDLSDIERRSIVAYLMTLERSEPLATAGEVSAGKPGAGEVSAGEELVKYYECYGCHAIAGFENLRPSVPALGEFGRRPVDELDFGSVPDLPRTKGDWLRQKLRAPRSFDSEQIKLKMPRMPLTEEEATALIVYASGLGSAPIGAAYTAPARPEALAARDAEWMTTRLHCNGCHRLGGKDAHIATFFERKSKIGPTLDGVGARLQGRYLYEFLLRPEPVRPWLTLRMPKFGFTETDARRLADGLAAAAGVNDPDSWVAGAEPDPERFERGFRRFHHYKCIQCHPSGADAPVPDGGSSDDLSINLRFAQQRLRPEWFSAFLADPKGLAGSDTRMPTIFYTVDGRPKVEHPDTDIADIVTYVMGMKEDAELAIAEYEKELEAEEEKDEVDWSSVEY